MPAPIAQTVLIVSDKLPNSIRTVLEQQLAADVMTNEQLEERQRQDEIADKQVPDTGYDDDEEILPDAPQSDPQEENAEQADAGDENQDAGEEDNTNKGDESSTTAADDAAKQKPEEPEDDLTGEAAVEHAKNAGADAYAYWARNGSAKYRQRVRKLRLAHETSQMTEARKQAMIKRFMYIKPADTGFTSKAKLAIATIDDPSKVVALVDNTDIVNADQELASRQALQALKNAGVEVYGTMEDLVDGINRLQQEITSAS